MTDQYGRMGRQPDTERGGTGQNEVLARFPTESAAEDAALALQRAGYHPVVSRAVWEPAEWQTRGLVLPTLVGGAIGMVIGTLLAAAWWGLLGAINVWSALQLPMGRALAGLLLYLVCTGIGLWLGYRYGLRQQQDEATALTATHGPHYAVAVPLTRTAMEREDIQRILEQHHGEDVEIRRVA